MLLPSVTHRPLSVTQVEGDEVARIEAGLLCLIGIRAEDGTKDADFM